MPMQLEDGRALLTGTCGPEDAAEFADWLRAGGRRVDLDGLTHMHCALLQCLMAFRPDVDDTGADPFIQTTLARARETGGPA